MKHVGGRNLNSGRRARKFFFMLPAAGLISFAAAAEDFGDISVAPNAIYTGNTFHGYAETRVIVENHSSLKAHTVALISPNRAYDSGNSISRLARTVTLAPGARETVSLLQPPLPLDGDGLMRVEVDGREEGEINTPNAHNHCNFSYAGRGSQPTILVSRSLDFDGVNLAMQTANAGGTLPGMTAAVSNPASQAAGAPGVFSGGRRNPAAAWMPNFRAGIGGNWLEINYTPTQNVHGIIIHSIQAPLTSGSVTVIGVAGTNLLTLPMNAAKNVSNHGQGWNVELSFPLTVEPVKTVRIDFGRMPPPAIAIDGVQITGPTGSQWASSARASSENYSAPRPSYGGGTPTDNIQCLRAESPVSEWSENWLAYTPFDAVVIGAADLRTLPPAIFNALGDYLFAGGNVILTGQTELPSAWQSGRKESLPDGNQYEIGLGKCLVFSAENISTADNRSIQAARDVTRESSRYWQALPNEGAAANALFPVVDNLKIPTRGLVVIMLAFVIVIGPVNLILLSRRQRRTWMLWTIPAISCATTLLVFAYSLLREGITPDTRIAGLTVLDQVHHHAATVGVTAFYCPLTPGGGLRFDFGTEATPLVRIGYGSGTSREVDWTQTQHFQRGWISARVPAHFHLRKSETRRERIQILNENGKLQALNSLGAPIKSLWLADAQGKIYQAENLPAGAKSGLIDTTHLVVSGQSGVDGLQRDLGFTLQNISALDANAARYLTPNTYIAELAENPFIENALGSAASPKRTKSSAVVFGILDPSEQ